MPELFLWCQVLSAEEKAKEVSEKAIAAAKRKADKLAKEAGMTEEEKVASREREAKELEKQALQKAKEAERKKEAGLASDQADAKARNEREVKQAGDAYKEKQQKAGALLTDAARQTKEAAEKEKQVRWTQCTRKLLNRV